MMDVDFRPGSPPGIGTPRQLFEFDPQDLIFGAWHVRPYNVAPDGQRFFVVQEQDSPPVPPVTHVNLVENWLEELKQKVPVR